MKQRLFAALLLLVAVLVCGGWLMLTPLPIGQERLLRVLPGTHFETVLQELSATGDLGQPAAAVSRRLLARVYARLTRLGTRLQVGEYPLASGDSLFAVLERLDRGEVMQRSFTLVDGWSFRQVRAALAVAPALTHELDGMAETQVAKKLGLEQPRVEGWLAPDTYFYTLGSSDLDILRRAHAEQQRRLASLWQARAPDLPYTSPYDALIMASLVEKETAVKAEMPQIAGVFVARLEQGMKLQTDPTVIYAMGERYHGRIGYRDLKLDSPYNTYLHYGLPPGPIAMPGRQALEAALHPAATKALYFVARGDGTHVFSRTLEAHNAAVRQYQLKRRDDYRSTPEPAAAEVTP